MNNQISNPHGQAAPGLPDINWPAGLRNDLKPVIAGLLDQVNQNIAETGVTPALRSYPKGEDQRSEHGSGGGSIPIVAIVPSNGYSACTPIVAGFASGSGSAPKGFRGVCRAIRRRLIGCMGQTEVVVIVTDCWNSRLIAESIEDFRAHGQRGLHLMIFLAHAGGLSQVDPGL
jgi:hypothetical protein